MAAQHLLQRVLRHPLRFPRRTARCARAARASRSRSAPARAVHPGGEHHVGAVVGRDRRGLPERVGDAPAPQVLAGAHVGGLGARAVADAVVPLHHQAGDAAVAELDGQRQPDRAGADDEDFGHLVHHERIIRSAGTRVASAWRGRAAPRQRRAAAPSVTRPLCRMAIGTVPGGMASPPAKSTVRKAVGPAPLIAAAPPDRFPSRSCWFVRSLWTGPARADAPNKHRWPATVKMTHLVLRCRSDIPTAVVRHSGMRAVRARRFPSGAGGPAPSPQPISRADAVGCAAAGRGSIGRPASAPRRPA